MKRNIITIFLISHCLFTYAQSKIIFSKSAGGLNTGGTLDLMLYNPVDNTTKLLLKGTVNRRGEYNAVTSPDIKKIIFNTYKFSGWKLGIGDFDGKTITNISKLTSRSNYEYNAKYAPDGSKIVYQEYNWARGTADIYIADKTGKNAKHFFTNTISDQNLAWTKDGKAIILTYMENEKLRVYLKSLDQKTFKKLSQHNANDFAVSSSKVENKIAFLSDKTGKIDLFVMDLDTGSLKNLTPNLKSADANVNSIWAYKTSWSPDGKQIVFNAMVGGDLELFIVNKDGSNLSQITNNNDTEITPFWTN